VQPVLRAALPFNQGLRKAPSLSKDGSDILHVHLGLLARIRKHKLPATDHIRSVSVGLPIEGCE
jgi:hypothetical protein